MASYSGCQNGFEPGLPETILLGFEHEIQKLEKNLPDFENETRNPKMLLNCYTEYRLQN